MPAPDRRNLVLALSACIFAARLQVWISVDQVEKGNQRLNLRLGFLAEPAERLEDLLGR
jgi:hypothetical protein